ncbi:hypothetical protein K457DRAFT_137442 [Linnemannia elongata AG-77]|uniref:Secreted protein n=1 Tax=Linnemannia elongata AG-77 TaxID=1314771 RepID=A0A197JY35_9FUNG|nr:hypothetical protein K457DRAFT_137442 [Linnemannia elongata AG-77]
MWTLLHLFIVHLSFSCFPIPCPLVLSCSLLTAYPNGHLPLAVKGSEVACLGRELTETQGAGYPRTRDSSLF